MKPLIINAIKSDGNIRTTLEILNAGQIGTIVQHYEEKLRAKMDLKDETQAHVFRIAMESESLRLKRLLQLWVKGDVWLRVKEQTGEKPDDIGFRISFYEALDDLQLSRAMMGEGFERSRNVEPMPLPVEMGKLKPRTIQRW